MLLTTTEKLEGYKILEYLGIVVGYGDDPEEALDDLEELALELGANAVIGIRIHNEPIVETGEDIVNNNYYAYGTAVKVEKVKE
ncbi:YbjQ family protein [Methanocaldococcus indicus]|uniref:YbjQ family protein n=1 Tax=Methanocaldococcus indicus TaxID=213231 RepID=UPI003C6D59F4